MESRAAVQVPIVLQSFPPQWAQGHSRAPLLFFPYQPKEGCHISEGAAKITNLLSTAWISCNWGPVLKYQDTNFNWKLHCIHLPARAKFSNSALQGKQVSINCLLPMQWILPGPCLLPFQPCGRNSQSHHHSQGPQQRNCLMGISWSSRGKTEPCI